MKCPHPKCKQSVLQKSGDRVRLRSHGPVDIDVGDGMCKTRCHWCKEPITFPVKLLMSDKLPTERFILAGERP